MLMSGNAMRSTRSKRSHNIWFLCRSMSSKSFTTVWWHVTSSPKPTSRPQLIPFGCQWCLWQTQFHPAVGCTRMQSHRSWLGVASHRHDQKQAPSGATLMILYLWSKHGGRAASSNSSIEASVASITIASQNRIELEKVMANIAPRHNLEVWQNGTLVPCCSTTIYSMWNIFHPYGFPLPWQKCSWSSAFGTCWELPIHLVQLVPVSPCHHILNSSSGKEHWTPC